MLEYVRPVAANEGMARETIAAALPDYDIEQVLGQGAMGVVLGGRHRKLARQVAIKQLPPAVADDDDARERFGAEARTLAALAHPHIVPVFDYVEREGLCLLVMESLPGGTVWDTFRADGLTPATTCAVAVAACAGLQHAHEHDVLHRDIKPENLMFAADRTLKVTDFGIAEALGGGQTLATADGTVVGTPAYMAPEQAQGAPLGPTADVYAIGTLLYELLSGRLPFDAEDQLGLLAQRLTADPVPLDQVAPDVPAPLVDVVMRALARDPSARPPTARALGAEVAAAASDAWGPDWLARSAVNVLAPMAPEARTNVPPPDATSGEAVHGPSIGAKARGTRVSGDDSPVADEPVRPTVAPERSRGDGTRLGELAREDLVAVQDVLTPPPVPRNALIGLVLALVALLVVAFAGLGSPSRTSADLRPGQLILGEADLATDDPASLDLGGELGLLVADDVAGAAATAELDLTAAGLPAGGSGREELVRQGQGALTTLDVGNAAHVTAGELTGDLRLLGPRGRVVFEHEFGVQPEGAPWLTLTFAVGAVGLLVALTYAGSASAPLRAGRRHRPARISLPIVGAAAGLALTILLWSLGVAPEPSVLTLLASVVLGALVGGLAGPVLFGLGRRRRLKEARRD